VSLLVKDPSIGDTEVEHPLTRDRGMVSGIEQLKSTLAAGDFDRILGTREDTWIDFKKEPYRLDTFKGRWEYTKDVAAFANGVGGCLVLGFKTGRPKNALVSMAESYTAIPKVLVDLKQHADAVANGVYPEVWGVTMSWFPPDSESNAGLLLIEVLPQRYGDKPFVMRSMLGARRQADECTRYPNSERKRNDLAQS
jgi:hypothetical protein